MPQSAVSTSPPLFPAPVLVSVSACVPRSGNRETPVNAELQELADSLRVIGLINPIHVLALADDRYEIYAGVRRWKAHGLIGATSIPAVVHTAPDERLAEQIRLIENLHRSEPSAFDISRSLRRLRNTHGYSYAETAAKTGMGLTSVKRYLGIFTASDALLLAAEKAQLPLKVVVELVRYETTHGEVAARHLLPRVIAGELSAGEIRARRKTRTDRAAAADRPTAPPAWDRLDARVAKVASADPATAKAGLKALIRRCTALLKELPAS